MQLKVDCERVMINVKQIVSLGIDVQEIKQVHGLIQAL